MDGTKDPREAAVERLKAKREFRTHAAVYVMVNLFLVIIWATGDRDNFWPFWTMAGWGIGLGFHAWSVFFQRPITEDAIQREMRKGSGD